MTVWFLIVQSLLNQSAAKLVKLNLKGKQKMQTSPLKLPSESKHSQEGGRVVEESLKSKRKSVLYCDKI